MTGPLLADCQECEVCQTPTANPSGFCDLEPQSWEDSQIVKRDQELWRLRRFDPPAPVRFADRYLAAPSRAPYVRGRGYSMDRG